MIRRIDNSIVNRVLAAMTLIGLTLSAPVFAAPATRVFPPGSLVPVPLTSGELSARWWRWNYETPNSRNPTLDLTGAKCGVGQSGPVFFLAGAPVTTPVTRTCTIPAGKILFFPLIAAECSNQEPSPFFGANEAQLRACAERLLDGAAPSSLKLTIDGTPVTNLVRFRARSPLFGFTVPEANQLGLPQGTSALSISDGFWIVAQVSPGNHVIHFEATLTSGAGAGFSQNITYNLKVKGAD